jgi:hypothetical protein
LLLLLHLPCQVAPPEELPCGGFGGVGDYLALMEDCWAQEPAHRPNFAAVISRLRRMLAQEASLRRDSPTKVPRAQSAVTAGGVVGPGGLGGAGGDDTPAGRSQLTSLTGGSDVCLSPGPRSTAGEDVECDTLGLAASPLLLSGPGVAGSSPPRHLHLHSSDGGNAHSPVQQLPIVGLATDDAEAAALRK